MPDSERIDLSCIVLGMESHRGLARAAAEHGVATIVHRPLAPNLEEFKASVDAAAARDG